MSKSTTMTRDLPKEWQTVKFGDVARNVREAERDLLAAGLERYVGLEHVEPENLHIKRWGLVAEGTSFTQVFRPGQVLFGKRRAYQRKVAVAEFAGVCSSDILIFEPKDDRLLPELLPFIVQSEGFFAHALNTSSGSLSPRTKWRDLASYEFVLPPKEEQRRIAEILWAADEATQSYTKAIEVHKELRLATTLSFMGILDSTELLEILRGRRNRTSTGWKVETIRSLASPDKKCVQVGPFGSSVSSKHFTQTGTPVLKINNLTDDGTLDLSELVFISDEYARELSGYRVSKGDLLTAAQATTGRSALATTDVDGAIISQHLIRVSVDRSKCTPEYLLACFLSPLVLQQIAIVKQKTTRDGLNTDDVENFRIPVPPPNEQQQVTENLKLLDRSFADLVNHLDKAKSLKRSLLQELIST
jgi:type I restriction enzyme S subunit